jgi:bacterioferritin
MKSSPEVIKVLEAGADAEARLNLQCRLDQRSLKFMGLKKLAGKARHFGDDAHFFLKKLTDRILLLGGSPAYNAGEILEQSTVTALFQNELALETGIVAPYEEAVQVAMKALDDASRNLFEHLLKWHEAHIGWLECQLRLIEGMGEATYISTKL